MANKMIEVKTADIIGPALDWSVAKAVGYQLRILGGTGSHDASDAELVFCFKPSTGWAQGGPLIDDYVVQLEPWAGYWTAKTDCGLGVSHYVKRDGNTPLIAVCRAIVAAKLGEVVSVPAELTGQ